MFHFSFLMTLMNCIGCLIAGGVSFFGSQRRGMRWFGLFLLVLGIYLACSLIVTMWLV